MGAAGGQALQDGEPVVGGQGLEELAVRALAFDPSVRKEVDAVAVRDGGEAVGDRDDPRFRQRLPQVREDAPLGAGVEVRGRLVEDQVAGMAQDRAGHLDPLALASGELEPVLAGRGVEVEGMLLVVQAGDRQRPPQLLVAGGAGQAEGDFLPERAQRQAGVERDDRDLG